MKYHIILDDEDDYKWLRGVTDKWLAKLEENLSGYVEYVDRFNRIHAAVHGAIREEGPVSEKKPKEQKKKKEKKVLPNLCPDHPTYGGIRVPRIGNDCEKCWSIFAKLNPTRIDQERRKRKLKNRNGA